MSVPTDLEHKNISASGGSLLSTNENDGVIEALVSVTGIVDNVGDIIVPGAYEKTLKERTPKGVAHHDWSIPVSKPLTVEEWLPGNANLPKSLADGSPWPSEAGALYVKAQFNLETQRGREAFSDAKFFGSESEWCVDEETQILTDRGWKYYNEVSTKDRAYTLDVDSGLGEFQTIEAVNVFEDKPRPMREIKLGGFSSLTTGDHKWPVRQSIGQGKYINKWVTTKDLVKYHGITRSAEHKNAPTKKTWSDAFVALVGWYWCEGWSGSDCAFISQSESANPVKSKKIRCLLEEEYGDSGWTANTRDNGITTYRITKNNSDAIFAVTQHGSKAPRFEFISELTTSQLHILVDTCIAGDGHVNKATSQVCWYQSNPEGVAAFEIICALAGVSTVTRINIAYDDSVFGRREDYPGHRVAVLKGSYATPLAAIATKERNAIKGIKQNTRTEAVDRWITKTGIVWCPTTANHTWLARRDGVVYFTGNSIGFKIPKGGSEKDGKTGIRHIKDIQLFEYSPVLFGAASNARNLLSAAKALFETEDEFIKEVKSVVRFVEDEPQVIDREELEVVGDASEDEKTIEVTEERLSPVDVKLTPENLAQIKSLYDQLGSILDLINTVVVEDETPVVETEKSLEDAVAALVESKSDSDAVVTIKESVNLLSKAIDEDNHESIKAYSNDALDEIAILLVEEKADSQFSVDLKTLVSSIDAALVKCSGCGHGEIEDTEEEVVEEIDETPKSITLNNDEWLKLLSGI